MHDLTGKVAVVTGAARGQGAASAAALAQAGAAVVLGDRDGHGAEQRAAEIREAGGRAVGLKADVRHETDVQAQIQRAVEEYGRLDILHSNAADLEILGEDLGITDFTVDLWKEQFETIALGAMLYCKHAIPAMIDSGGGGSIICTSSISAEMGELNLTVYAAAKASINQVIRSVSAQWGKNGIRANAVAPGLVLSIPGKSIGEEMIGKYIEQCDITHVGEPEDIANVVAFLASDDSRYITGQVLRVDGGFTQHSPLVAGSRATGMMAGQTFTRNG